ncbi:hypothetical protein [Parendozoicomonas haliclonae]|uniref:Tautomerase enzyme n=1 Tax=Parendozoicomonas haliclonae TaxID=1960125 RepID=A0A1X7ARQ4_9GAMM|nr:hypothetical protein [Parendozoicomonas haliclonae]SMA50915.1 hypothetical protein EHSB41UT_04733 [Parendozoicomonas haliclonae]
MPLYTVTTRKSLPDQKREELANLIMNVHCGLTGAPETFVNVMYWENAPLNSGIAINVLGTVRKGRTPDMNQTLQNEMAAKISDLLLLSAGEIEMSLFEMPAQWIMEGGEVLPEPGEEAFCEWLQKGHAE